MPRYFKIIKDSKYGISLVKRAFKIGKIYQEAITSDLSKDPELIGEKGERYWVDESNIQEVSLEDYLSQRQK